MNNQNLSTIRGPGLRVGERWAPFRLSGQAERGSRPGVGQGQGLGLTVGRLSVAGALTPAPPPLAAPRQTEARPAPTPAAPDCVGPIRICR